jgi:ribosome-associated toxin RatA of RatAB toxin-antitoxin module
MEFNTTVECDYKEFLKILKDFENLPKYLPRQLQKIQILEKQDSIVIIEVILAFKSLIKNEISQKIKINTESDNKLILEVLDGHAKNTKVWIVTQPNDRKTQVNVNINLKLSLKARILSPIIKREYKSLLTGVFIKIGIDAENTLEVK